VVAINVLTTNVLADFLAVAANVSVQKTAMLKHTPISLGGRAS
jgi:hypothetical protein